ncbi:MAG: GntR family transcriptional regulator [Deltaproteobacteria bacterium]|nr:MAG: GntR family transcriptional regulator [Deltaproteobacteria bacterium]
MLQTQLTGLLPKQHQVALGLLDLILRQPADRLPSSEVLARQYRVNINTAKKALTLLADAGILEPKRRVGNLVRHRPDQARMHAYLAGRQRILSALGDLAAAGFSPLEMAACLAAASDEHHRRTPRIVYADFEFNELLLGTRELELACGQPVRPVPVPELENLLREGWLTADLVVTTFFAENRVRPLCEQAGIVLVPLRTTPPLEQLLNFALLPRDTPVTLVVLSGEIRQRIEEHYPHLHKDFPAFSILTLEQVRKSPKRLGQTRILLAHKLVCEEYAELFRSIPRVIGFNRFQDDEGLDYIRALTQPEHRETQP